jgi:hypothetical protein
MTVFGQLFWRKNFILVIAVGALGDSAIFAFISGSPIYII